MHLDRLDLRVMSGLLAEGDLDERAMDAIKEFPPHRALEVLAEFKQSNLEHVTNKSAFLCSIMKVNRQKIKGGSSGTEQLAVAQHRPGPDEDKLKVNTISFGLRLLVFISDFGSNFPSVL